MPYYSQGMRNILVFIYNSMALPSYKTAVALLCQYLVTEQELS